MMPPGQRSPVSAVPLCCWSSAGISDTRAVFAPTAFLATLFCRERRRDRVKSRRRHLIRLNVANVDVRR
jgi:hypothetical protein